MALVSGGYLHYHMYEEILKKSSLKQVVSLFKNRTRNFDPSINMAVVKWGLLAQYVLEEIIKKSSLKLLVRF